MGKVFFPLNFYEMEETHMQTVSGGRLERSVNITAKGSSVPLPSFTPTSVPGPSRGFLLWPHGGKDSLLGTKAGAVCEPPLCPRPDWVFLGHLCTCHHLDCRWGLSRRRPQPGAADSGGHWVLDWYRRL